MDIISAYQQVGSFRGAAALCGTTHKTVKRIVEKFEAGETAPPRDERARNYDAVTELVAERVAKSAGRMSAKRMLPIARAAGYEGPDRNFRRLVAAKTLDPFDVAASSIQPRVSTTCPAWNGFAHNPTWQSSDQPGPGNPTP